MNRRIRFGMYAVLALVLAATATAHAQEVKLVADSVAVQADGTFEADPDLAALVFSIRVQEKELKQAYAKADAALDRILQLAQRNGLGKQEISTGALTVAPQQDWNDRKIKVRAYRVERRVTFRLKDFTKIGTLIDEAVQDEITEFRSLAFTLENEEKAKQQAIAEASKNAEARARAALNDGGRKLGALRSINVEVRQLVGVTQVDTRSINGLALMIEAKGLVDAARRAQLSSAALAEAAPEKIRVTASVQCLYQLQ